MAVGDGWVVDHQLAGRRGVDDDVCRRAGGEARGREVERDGLGGLSARLVNVATPPITVTDVVPWSGPAPLASDAVTTVVLSPVIRLPNWSSS